MMQQRFRVEQTRQVPRERAFQAREADLDALVAHIRERRNDGSAAMVVGVIDASGVRVRVVEGAGPALVSVGRHPGCDVPLHQGDASMRHAVVVRDDVGVRVVDLSSSYGLTGRASGALGQWTLVRAGDSLITAAALGVGQMTGDIDELRWLCDESLGPLALGPLARGQAGPFRPRSTPLGARIDGSRACAWALPEPPIPVARETPLHVREHAAVSLGRLRGFDGPLLMGRDDRCQVRFDENEVSRLHAALLAVQVGGARRAMVVDVGSTNGTTVLQARDGAIREVALGPAGRGQLVRAGDMVELAGERVRIVGTIDDDGALDALDARGVEGTGEKQ